MNSTALMVAKAAQFLFRNNEQKKRYTLLIIVLVFATAFCMPVIMIATVTEIIESRVNNIFAYAGEVLTGLFGDDIEDLNEDFQIWLDEDFPVLDGMNEETHPSLSLAYGISYYYQVIQHQSVFSVSTDYMNMFINDDPAVCISQFTASYGIEINESQLDSLNALGSQLRFSMNLNNYGVFSVSGGQLLPVDENTYYPGSDARAAEMWQEAFLIGGGNPYYYAAIDGKWSPRQCTTFAWYRFYQYYGYDSGARGDGKNCAKQVVAAHPDSFRLSSMPAPGSIVSFPGTRDNSHGHVAFVEKVEGEWMWYSEGNYEKGGIRLNRKVSIEALHQYYCGSTACLVYAVPISITGEQ